MLHAAIFDMDGLLFDTERLCCEAWKAVSEKDGYAMADELFFSCVGRNNRDTRELVMKACGPEFPYERFRDEAREWMHVRMDVNGPPEKPGIRPLFEFLKSRNIPIALATSSSETSARWMIDRAGLTPYFSACAFGSEVEKGKPAPDIFLLALSRLGSMAAKKCVVFEDSPAGLRAADAAGMRSVFIKDMIDLEDAVLARVWRRIERLDEAASDHFYQNM